MNSFAVRGSKSFPVPFYVQDIQWDNLCQDFAWHCHLQIKAAPFLGIFILKEKRGQVHFIRRAKRRVVHSNGWESRNVKSQNHVAWMVWGYGNAAF